MRSRYIWLLLFFVAISLISFSKKEATIEVYGKVLHKDRGLSSVEVTVERPDLNHLYPYYEPTRTDGNYELKFNVHEGRPVKISYKRKGYSTLILEKTFSGKKTRESLGEVDLIRLPGTKEDFKIGTLKTSDQYPYLQVFPGKDTKVMPDTYHPNKILYFSYIKKQECFEIRGAYWYYVNFKVDGQKEAVTGYVLQ